MKDRIKDFIASTPKGSSFEFTASETGEHSEDGTVIFNDNGLEYRIFESMEDFISHHFLGVDVVYLSSMYVGSRDDEGNITWNNGTYPQEDLDDLEDGSSVYLLPTLYANIDKDLLENINSASADTLLDISVKKHPEVEYVLAMELIKRKSAALKV